jgi:hypothetical protein
MSQSQPQEREDHFGDMFNIALVLLGVLSATETPYFSKIWNISTALKFAIYPFLLMIMLWLFKELFKKQFEKENRTKVWLVLSETCWEIWSLSLSFYLLFLAIFMVPIPPVDFSYSLIIGAIVFGSILFAYRLEYNDKFPEYYKSLKWIFIRAVLMAVFAYVVYVIFLPIK